MSISLDRVGHWTPRYIADRVALAAWERLNPDMPWLTADALRILPGMLRPTDHALEWGSGRSTRWFAMRVAALTSVEHDKEWFKRVSERISGLSHVEYLYRESSPDASDALAEAYAAVADRFADGSLDVVLVDGQARDRCAQKALPKLKPGGVLIVDNINWYLPSESRSPSSVRSWNGPSRWREVADELASWRRIWTSNGVTDTAIWIKPAST